MRSLVAALVLLSCVAIPATAQPVVVSAPGNLTREQIEKSMFSMVVATFTLCLDPATVVAGLGCFDAGTSFARLIDIQLASYPTSAPAGGFTFTFNRAARVWTRRSPSFGPTFAERPLTNGRGKISVGFNSQYTAFSTLDGSALDSLHGSSFSSVVNGTVTSSDVRRNNVFLTSVTSSIFAVAGITNRLDVGVLVPYKRIDLQIQSSSLRNDCTLLLPSGLSGPCRALDFATPLKRTAAGVGDVAIRGKYQLLDRARMQAAFLVERTLSTGDAENFLGAGRATTKVMGVASAQAGVTSSHVNVGYLSGRSSLQAAQSRLDPTFTERFHALTYTAGLDAAVDARFTVSGDLIGQRLSGVGRLVSVEATGQQIVQGQVAVITRDAQVIQSGSVNLLLASVGFKYNLMNQYLLKVDVLLPMTKSGLQGRWTPTLGLDYTF